MSESISITHEGDEEGGAYRLLVDGAEVGELTYSRRQSGRLSANHTFIDPDRRQKGMARKLVDRLAEDARQESVKVSPVCPYVRWVFEENEADFQDVWDR